MKKGIGLLLCVGAIPLLTGCGGGNKLVCTLKDEGESSFISYEYTINYSGDEIKSIDIDWIYDFSNVEDFEALGCTSLEDCVSKAKEQKSSCDSQSTFENCKITKESKDKVILNARVADSELDNETGDLTRKTSKEDAKKSMEASGFKCS
jgi:hypothetical protein